MLVDAFDFDLPSDSIALRPAIPRDAAKMLVVRPGSGLADAHVRDLPGLLGKNDVLVVNDTRVIPARLTGQRTRGESSARIDVTLHKRASVDRWLAFVRPAKKLDVGEIVRFSAQHQTKSTLEATVLEKHEGGEVLFGFSVSGAALDAAIAAVGAMPLPPYIAAKRDQDAADQDSYQTMFARELGAVAAPTAGLHFTPELMEAVEARGIAVHRVTLHVGAGTFLPVKVEDTADHRMHAEWGTIDATTAAALNAARARGGRIVAVGTTSLRILETAADPDGTIMPFSGDTAIFITPGYRFRAVDALMTNFHLPRSTLFMLVAAFSGLPTMRDAYGHAIRAGYRFYSYGDASLLFPETPRVTDNFSFTVHATDGAARTGEINNPRGTIRTPAFMPVGTAGTVKAMYPGQVRELGADIVLGNTYHLMLRPGAERVAKLGGLHTMMNWPHPILTDSGGFQVMSLAKLRKLDETGVTFQSHLDGSRHVLTPERSMEIQDLLGSDIQMQLDECVRLPASREDIERAMLLSLRWAERSKRAFGNKPGRAIFAIVQGGDVAELRVESAKALAGMDFPGYAVGGLAVGEPQDIMLAMIETVAPHLPDSKPRYLMGVGTPDDLVESVRRGIDMFDCVMPTRAGRHGLAYTRFGKVNLRNAKHADDPRPLDLESSCPAARTYSRAYLHHLVKSGEILGMMLLSWVNLAYYQALMAGIRDAIVVRRFEDFVAETKAAWLVGDVH